MDKDYIKQNHERFRSLGDDTPLYLYDPSLVRKNLGIFKAAFKEYCIDVDIFYAVKSNSYINLLKTVVDSGSFLDVSSTRELDLAIKAGCKKIVYTGPGKSLKDLKNLLDYNGKIYLNLDSFAELKRLSGLDTRNIICGVRIHTSVQSGWNKFGISLNELRQFYDKAKESGIVIRGIHFHQSFNSSAEPYSKTIEALKDYLADNFSDRELRDFSFLDIGGGFFAQDSIYLYPWNEGMQLDYPEGKEHVIDNILNDRYSPRYIKRRSVPITGYAKEICKSFKRLKELLVNCGLFSEPGRFICHDSMHFLTRIVDKKSQDSVIVDAGNNMVGYERYQFYNYAPIINLTRFDLKNEVPAIVYGSLCTPDDIWGYYIYCKSYEIGDLLLIPFQGDYTFTLAQNFIKEIPDVIDL